MTATQTRRRPTRTAARGRFHRRWSLAWRRMRHSETALAIMLGAVVAVTAFASVELFRWLPLTAIVIPMLVANLTLGPRTLPWFVVYSLACLSAGVKALEEIVVRQAGGIVVIFAIGLIILISSFRRSPLGVAGARGESMLIDLRTRISNQGTLPELPPSWYAEAVMRSAGGSSFAGDFIVSTKTADGRLEVAVVDVSGKGEQAGTRALLLSGAFSGLLGALPAGGFLPAANDYLLRQNWDEGFATAIHLSLDLETGEFELRSAGHPPAVQLQAGSGRWVIHQSEGPVLGLMSDAEFLGVDGRLSRGDAILMYTDGLVETPQRDIAMGIDKLVGQGERLLRGGFERGAHRLINRLESQNDDRALLLVHHR